MARLGSSNVVFNKLKEQAFTRVKAKATYTGIGIKLLYFALMTVIGAGLGIGLLYFNPGALSVILAFSGILTFVFALLYNIPSFDE